MSPPATPDEGPGATAPSLDRKLAERAAKAVAKAPASKLRDPMLGLEIDGKYRVDAPLGRGGSGQVYVATQLSLHRQVALKIMRPELEEGGDERYAERFFREASKAGALAHPNVVTVHDYGRTEEGLCYIAMELLDGRSLKRIMREGPIELERTLDIFEQVVRGLRHAHKAGLVHRDVKPGNVQILSGDEFQDVAKLLDFGLVKSAEAEVTEITRDGSFLGTPHYAAPEQVRGLEADARSDLYAVGVMLYRALTGKLPFESRNAMALAMSHVRDPYPPMAERVPGVAVPEVLEAVVRRCMEKDPGRRYQNADFLLADLQQVRRTLLEPTPVLSMPVPEVDLGDEQTISGGSRRWVPVVLMAAALASVLASVGIGAAVLMPGDPAPEVQVSARTDDAQIDALAEVDPEIVALPLVVLSDPPGATVFVDGQARGQTPWADAITGESGVMPHVRLELAGYRTVDADVVADGGTARVDTVLERLTPRRTAVQAAVKRQAKKPAGKKPAAKETPKAAPAAPRGLIVDGVAFTAAEASRTLAFANGATEAQLRAVGIGTTQLHAVERGRPYATLQAVGAAGGVGPKTVERLKTGGG